MTNRQLWIAAGLPTVTGFVSIAFALILSGRLESRMDRMAGELSARMDCMAGELSSRIDHMAADLSQFYMVLGRHNGKIESLEREKR